MSAPNAGNVGNRVRSPPPSAEEIRKRANQYCPHFLKGSCKIGDSCHWSHAEEFKPAACSVAVSPALVGVAAVAAALPGANASNTPTPTSTTMFWSPSNKTIAGKKR